MADERLAEQLLGEVGWVRQLAARLAGAHGDDVAQDAWLVAERQEPDADRPLRPWLATVVRKLARTRRRSEARRHAHEAAADAPEAVASPESLAVRAELLRLVGELVAGLDEPSRSTILLRYYEGLTSQQIAARLSISDGTVRWRLKQAVDELRRQLDTRVDGGRRVWSAAFLALPHTAAVAKGATMITILKLGVAVCLVAAGGMAGVRALRPHGSSPSTATPPGAASPKAQPADDGPALEAAKQAYVEGRYDDAIQHAREGEAQDEAKAWRIIGAASCFKQDGVTAGEAWQRSDDKTRQFLEYVCKRNETPLPNGSPVM